MPLNPPPRDPLERLVAGGDKNVAERARSELFFREFALHMARQATTEFQRTYSRGSDGAAAVKAFIDHEQEAGRLRHHEITSSGRGFHIKAQAHACPYAGTCKTNLKELGEVPQCVRAITLIQAVSARVPDRPPMTYDLRPGLVDGTGPSCQISLRPAALPDLEPLSRP
jgi:hypothetical protein